MARKTTYTAKKLKGKSTTKRQSTPKPRHQPFPDRLYRYFTSGESRDSMSVIIDSVSGEVEYSDEGDEPEPEFILEAKKWAEKNTYSEIISASEIGEDPIDIMGMIDTLENDGQDALITKLKDKDINKENRALTGHFTINEDTVETAVPVSALKEFPDIYAMSKGFKYFGLYPVDYNRGTDYIQIVFSDDKNFLNSFIGSY